MALVTVKRLRTIQWDKSNNWSIEFPQEVKVGHNGGEFFPANDSELTFFGIENEQIGSTGLELPKGRTIPNITLSYIDDETLSITGWLTNWIKDIVSEDGYRTKYLVDSYKTVVLTKLDSMKNPLYTWTLSVIPNGNIQFHGDSDGSLPLYSMNFTVVGGALNWESRGASQPNYFHPNIIL